MGYRLLTFGTPKSLRSFMHSLGDLLSSFVFLFCFCSDCKPSGIFLMKVFPFSHCFFELMVGLLGIPSSPRYILWEQALSLNSPSFRILVHLRAWILPPNAPSFGTLVHLWVQALLPHSFLFGIFLVPSDMVVSHSGVTYGEIFVAFLFFVLHSWFFVLLPVLLPYWISTLSSAIH